MLDLLVLAHVLSQDNPWIPLLTVGGIAVLVVFGLAAAGRLTIDEPGDLLLPGATVVLAAGLAGSAAHAAWLLGQGPWIVPSALVIVVALVVVSLRDGIDVGPGARRTTGVVAGLALVAGAAAFVPLDRAWFGEEPTVFAVDPVDAEVALELVEGPDADGRFVVRVTVTDGTIGDNVPRSSRPADPEQEMFVKFYVNGQPRFPAVPEDCAADPTCTTTTFELYHVAEEPLREVSVEMLTADQVAFSSVVGATLDADELAAP